MSVSTVTARLGASLMILLSVLLASARIQAAPPVRVSAADPNSAPQATLDLDVTVSGSGFDSSAAVDFFVTGTANPGGVTVKKVTVLGSKKLVARIDVADAAVIADFDIHVKLSGGRKGKGTSLFRVTAKVTDPCAAPDLDFPAFTFRGATETTEEVIYVTDANATCIREIGKFTVSAGDAFTTVFSYPVAGTADVGRIVWLVGHRIYGLTFLIAGTTVTPYSVELLYESVGTQIRFIDMSKDGSTVYASLDSLDPTDSLRIIAITVSDRSVRDVYVGAADSSDFTSLTVDESGSLFVTQEPPNAGVPTDMHWQVLRIDPGCAAPACTAVIATGNKPASDGAGTDKFAGISASLVDNRLVYEHSGITACSSLLQVALDDGGPVPETAQPMFGRRSSWYGGKIFTNGFKVNKRGCTISNMISQFDPDTGAETVLVRGYDPDGR